MYLNEIAKEIKRKKLENSKAITHGSAGRSGYNHATKIITEAEKNQPAANAISTI